MATDIDELSHSKISETSISTMINGNGMATNVPNVVIPSSISVANAVSKIDANVAAQNAHNHYTTVVKKVRNTPVNNHTTGMHTENGNTTTMTTIPSTATAAMMASTVATQMAPVPMNGTSNTLNAHINNHHHNHNNHHIHRHPSNYTGLIDFFFHFFIVFEYFFCIYFFCWQIRKTTFDQCVQTK